ncbi:Putative bacterioferritin-associated ferredoxin [Mycoavidus cysteinexigens]|uniref:Bacterioferritin-associated ferredoxin n=1 Tax=Mycoavidus cysteinexigens TaxID=1553431 RepID=A0A2Z6EUT4_9BURK|nr:(2Fe-2S)-binding protein [Mycoavidus cysteinexigens]BBE08845.1 Putative bacterioferritin-associated ferredoxin [Mycoavidus cysteinexigens]GAM52439.1 bacterioferritin-associated ferredoxin [bacterium endosymbiont of Mortierella elongata FMR23-6]GLR01134.1 bacterioferritin-associated ferredoxin [Mycoavidus cysteinexigens]
MIICVCKSVSDRSIHTAIHAGANSLEALQFECGVALCCGKCENAVSDLLANHNNASTPCGAAPLNFVNRAAA